MAVMLTAVFDLPAASASSLEKWLIMPGPVIAAHADIEDDCGACHDPGSDRPQFELCVACHEEVGRDLENDAGFHGRLPRSEARECADCHTDHEGRDFDAIALDESTFDHSLTEFELRGAHTDVACDACHNDGEAYRQAATTCVGCHRTDDPHMGQLGEDCVACHGTRNWTETFFDHDKTSFPLMGAHASVSCDACHRSATFGEAGKTCSACHRQDDVHQGRNGPQCADCHVTDAWKSVTFNHLLLTGFPLAGGHGGLTCEDCHKADDFRDLGGAQCVACHRADDVHEGGNGDSCGNCHDIVDWRAVMFNHTTRTSFPLPPGHDELACNACHSDDIHDALPRSCEGCHEDVHKGQLGPQCDSCHEATNWTRRVWFDHDITRFPLIGAHGDIGCDRCHADAAFHDAATECSACHEQDDVHAGSFGPRCNSCHNPSDWGAWQFDHGTETAFPLSGAHEDLPCADCHEPSTKHAARVSDDCSSCHRRDDPHFGRFGNNCSACHSTAAFAEIEGL